jgi:Domain of unknown function (DUF4190)
MTSQGPHSGYPDPWGPAAGGQGNAPYGSQPPAPTYPGQPSGQFVPPPGGVPPYGQPYGYGYPYVPPRRTNGLAVASMVLGILWIYWIGSVLALIFGYIARSQIRERGEAGDGMAIAGIVLGWVGIGIVFLVIVFGLAARTSF